MILFTKTIRTDKFNKSFLKIEKNSEKIEAIAFVINSSGGSAVCSNKIASQIKEFCQLKKIKLFTFSEDYAASGGYWLLCVGDEVYCYNSSKVGSIGVLFTTLDFKSFLEKHKIDRKIISSKTDKNSPDFNEILDMFSHKKQEDYAAIEKVTTNIRIAFQDHVIKYRKEKLTKNEEALDLIFNANVFLGDDAKKLG